MSWDKNNPWNKYIKPFTQQGSDPLKPFTATAVHGRDEMAAKRSNSEQVPVSVDLPAHLYRPRDAQDLDIRSSFTIGPGPVFTPSIFKWRCPLGAMAYFLSFGLFKNNTVADIAFAPRVNGSRIFPYVGESIGVGAYPITQFVQPVLREDFVATSFENQYLSLAQIILNPSDLVSWDVSTTFGGPFRAGVRMVGYVDYTQKRSNMRSGG